MSSNYIKIIGDDLWFDGMKVGTLLTKGVPPSVVAAVRRHMTHALEEARVKDWQP